MFHKYVILTRGFKNRREDGTVTGYQMLVRIPYYRGIYLSLIDSLELEVDGEAVERHRLRFGPGRRLYTMDELREATDERWSFGDPAVLAVKKEGGLPSGMHDVSLAINIRKSYIPTEDPEGLFGFARGFWRRTEDGAYTSDFGVVRVTKRLSLVQ